MPKAIVLGGYGLIGSACLRALDDAGFEVTGIGRSNRSAARLMPRVPWIIRDIPSITVEEWQNILEGVDVVVNASGALQDSAKDSLEEIHVTAVDRLVKALGDRPTRLVHISAAGVSKTASTSFFRTKAAGDKVIAGSSLDWVILRPTLVLSPEAYGGTALLRAAAAFPLVHPKVFPDAQVQTVHIQDVANAVVLSAQGKIPAQTIADLTEPETHNFSGLLKSMRSWMGIPAARLSLSVPIWLIRAAGKCADLTGYFGWRSPLRTTALLALSDGIQGDPTTWETIAGKPCRSLDTTLSQLPATRQERLFARAFIGLPLAIGTLAIFWCLSGLITLVAPSAAIDVLVDHGAPEWSIAPTVIGGAVADIALGLAILWRPWTSRAALGMIALSCAYLFGGLIVAPALWADPLGPMIKVFPSITLALLVWMMMENE